MRGDVRVSNILVLLGMLAIPAACGGWFYQSFRSWQIVFDVDWRERVLLIALVGVLPAWYGLAVLAGLLEISRWAPYAIRRRRLRRGGCWQCGYPIDPQRPRLCTECGRIPTDLPEHRYPTIRGVLVAAILVAAAVVPAALLGDLYVTTEDLRFVEEVRRQGGQQAYYRDRAWPNQDLALVFNPPHGFHVND